MKEEGNHTNESHLELKYCERCGGLWLRERGSGESYCVSCAEVLEEMAPVTTKPDRSRLPGAPRWRRLEPEPLEEDEGFEASMLTLQSAGGVA